MSDDNDSTLRSNQKPLPPSEGFSLQSLEADPFWALIDPHFKSIFDERELILRPFGIYSDSEKQKLKTLGEKFPAPFASYTILLHHGSLAGWSWGQQDSRDSYYMVNSAILPAFRGRGLYRWMLSRLVPELAEKGFQRIWSRHNTTNNAVLVAKMKQGFQITGTELSDVFGSLVHLTYFTNPTRKKILSFRSGSLRPDEQLKKLFRF